MKTLLTAIGTLSACTATRWFLDSPHRKEKRCAGDRVRLTALWNEGAAFGLKIPKSVLLSLSGAVLGTFWMERKRHPVGAGLVLGGGFSNLLERLRHGKVYDYLSFPKAPKPVNRYVYNLADAAILVGGLLWSGGKKR